MSKIAAILLVSLMLLLIFCGPIEPALGQQPSDTAEAARQKAQSKRPSTTLFIRRRYLRIPIQQNSEEHTVVLRVAGEEVKRFAVRLATASADLMMEIDMSPWLGTIVGLESQTDADIGGAMLFASVSQSNGRLAEPDAKADVGDLPGVDKKSDVLEKANQAANDEVSFAFEIQPLLSEKCFACHGPDSKNAESDLKLSDRANAIDYGAFIAGDAENSEAIARIVSDDEDLLMPPPESHKSALTESELNLLKRWIDQGAKYESHWSFTPLQPTASVAFPTIVGPQNFVIRNPIDAFVSRKLSESGLTPNADQSPHRLIRRLSFDLVGLPPQPEIVQRFVETPTDEVYEEIVDELLASHHYGEHWALNWLDSVRYADTHGIHIDNSRAIWPYRDWVINAFNANMPFDQFTVEQIAGDMLPEATMSQKVASGYNRCLPTTSEGGVIDAEVAVNNANDQTASTFAVWQGLTVGCAACHDHKFDPISQKEYYQLTAFFRNNEMKPKDGNINAPPPTMPVPSQLQADKKRRLEKNRDELVDSYQADLEAWETENKDATVEALATRWQQASDRTHPLPVAAFELFPQPRHVTSTKEDPDSHLGIFGTTPVLNKRQIILCDEELPNDLGSSFSFGGFLRVAPKTRGVVWAKMFADQQTGWDLSVSNKGQVVVRVSEQPEARMLDVSTDRKIDDGKWHHVFVVLNQKVEDYPLAIYIDGGAQKYRFNAGSVSRLPKDTTFATEAKVTLGRRDDRGEGGDLGRIENGELLTGNFQIFTDAITAVDVQRLQTAGIEKIESTVEAVQKLASEVQAKVDRVGPDAKDAADEKKKNSYKDAQFAKLQIDDLKATQRRLLMQQLLHAERPKLAQSLQRKAEIDASLVNLKQRIPITLVMKELKATKPKAHILDRGDYASPLEEVSADVPAVLPAFKESAPKNRLGLAGWMVSPENPLTARVTVNRYWYYLFGTAIVETTEDFGVTGARPSHPDLLNWMAADFVEHDWDLKHLLRNMVTSSTYRQSQKLSLQKRTADPDNRLLSRGPRVRLDGEQLRDMALSNAELLVDKIGGPPVKPYQPKKLWQEVSMAQSDTRFYRPDFGNSLYRRSLYTFWKRTAAPPTMTIMNSPDRDVFCVRRERTNTPLQAFVMWNDPQFVEASKMLAEQIVQRDQSFETSIDDVGQKFLSRPFLEDEKKLLKATLDSAREAFEAEPNKAQALLQVGDSKISDDVDPLRVAAWTVVVSQVMNLDEALTK